MQLVTILTTIDITPTGIRHKTDDPEWLFKRNQQRNYDTLLQVIGLRCQALEPVVDSYVYAIEDLENSVMVWRLKFTVDRSGVLGDTGELFLQDIEGVPIVPGLNETTPSFPPTFMARGKFKNISIFLEDSN